MQGLKPKGIQKGCTGCPLQRAARRIAATTRRDPASFEQRVERSSGHRYAANSLDPAPGHRLVVGDDRQRFERGSAGLAGARRGNLQFRREIGGGAEGPAAAATLKLHTAPIVLGFKRLK